MKQKEFTTTDLYLTAVISILLETQPGFRVENGKVIFVFPISDNLYKAMNAYNSGESLNAYDLVQKIKRLRAEMLSLKGGQR